MADRRFTAWFAGLAALGVACLGMALCLGWWAAQLFHESDVFYRGTNGDEGYTDEVYRYYDTISSNSYALHDLTTPLLAGAVLAVIASLAVLALRRDRREGKRL